MQPFVEDIQPGRGASFACKRFEQRGFPFEWHLHPEAELTLITAGRGQRFVGDDISPFREGDLVLLAGGLPHTWYTPADAASPRSGGKGVGSVVVQFMGTFLGEDTLHRPELAGVGRLLERARLGLFFPPRTAKTIAPRLEAMVGLLPLNRLTTLLELLDQLSRCRTAQPLSSQPFTPTLRPADRTRLDRVCRFINQRLTEPITQAQAARVAHLSPAAFARFFKRMTGQSFVEYVHRLRVGLACRLLVESDAAVTEVCFAVGFGNVSNFNRVFKRHKDVSPREYRKAFAEHAG